MPANTGVPADVPPTASLLPEENTRYASWSADAGSDTSGTSREQSPGTPGPACQAGFEKNALAPPPDEEGDLSSTLSFHAVSGMYEIAEAWFALFAAFQ